MEEAKGHTKWPDQSNSKSLAGFINDQDLHPNGDYYYDGRKIVPSRDED
jgi:hypothetical protein